MTLEDAYSLLDIPSDEKLNIEHLEKYYNEKIKVYTPDDFSSSMREKIAKKREKIEEAYKYLCNFYNELYTPPKKENTNENFPIILASSIMAIVTICLIIVLYFFMNKEYMNTDISGNVNHDKKYEQLLREIESLKKRADKQENIERIKSFPTENTRDYADLIARVMPSMVFIKTSSTSLGSGFFVSPNGDILTNYHVIKNAEYLHVTTHGNNSYIAQIKGFDSIRDIALLKIDAQAQYLELDEFFPRLGETVIAIGNPNGLLETVSDGIVSGVREFNSNIWIQFTAPISQGSSGGALVNLQGKIIGMPTQFLSHGQNINFAVASTELKKFLNSAINKPARTFIAQKTQPRQEATKTYDIPGLKFVGQDDGYKMYLDTEKIDYNKRTQIASFVTLWWLTEKSKIEMRKDPHFNIPVGEDLGLCLLLYTVDFKKNKYVHLRTVNLCTDGETIARDYIKPDNEIKWRTPKKGSRIQLLMREVRKQLNIK